jgi:hypothetical protein
MKMSHLGVVTLAALQTDQVLKAILTIRHGGLCKWHVEGLFCFI